MMKYRMFSLVAVIVAFVPLVLADSVSIATVRGAANTASEELKSCVFDEVKSQLFRGLDSSGRQRKSSRNPDCYIGAIGRLKSLVGKLVSQPETSLDARCIERLNSTITSLELNLLSLLSADAPSSQALEIKKLRDQVNVELITAIDYCEQKK